MAGPHGPEEQKLYPVTIPFAQLCEQREAELARHEPDTIAGQPAAPGPDLKPPAASFEPGSLAARTAARIHAWAEGGRSAFALAGLTAGMMPGETPADLLRVMDSLCAVGLARLVSPAPNHFWKILAAPLREDRKTGLPRLSPGERRLAGEFFPSLAADRLPTQEEAAELVRGFHEAHPDLPVRSSLAARPRRHPMQVTGEPLMDPGPELEPLPPSGAPMENVRTAPDRDYVNDTDLLFDRAGQSFSTRMTPADQVQVGAAVLGPEAVRALVRSYLVSLLDAREQSAEDKKFFERDIEALNRVGAMLRDTDKIRRVK